MYFEIYKDDQLVNTIVADETFAAAFCARMGYTYKAIERVEPDPEPTEADDTATMLIDHEYRLTLLELGITE